MKKIYTTIILFLFSVSIISCSKDDEETSPVTSIDGNYKFAGLQVDVATDVSITYQEAVNRTVADYKYTTGENLGTVVIGNAKMTSSNLGYSISTTAHSKSYLNGQLVNSVDQPMEVSVPASSGSAKYKQIGNDSLYFESGFVILNSQIMPSAPVGAKFSVEGDKLILKINLNNLQDETQQNTRVVSKMSHKIIMTLQRQ